MDLLTAPLARLQAQAAAVVNGCGAERALERATDDELAGHLSGVAAVARLVEALLVDAVGEAMRRSETPVRDDRLTSRLGCRDVGELVQKLARVAAPTAARLQRAAAAVRLAVSEMTGDLLDAPFPEVREAMTGGVVGLDGILAIVEPLQATAPRVAPAARREAAAIVVAEARGEGPDGAPPVCAALLRIHAQTWALALDQDGAEPRERAAQRKRALTLGAATPHGVPVRGMLLPDVAAQLQTIFDAQLAPRVAFTPAGDDPDAPRDERTRAQQQHDAFAAALGVAASSGMLPRLGGHAPTLVVQVRAEDLESGSGHAHVQGCDEPISVAAARHIGCGGVAQRVTVERGGRIVAIGTEERVFNRHQRRAIALRDGGCIIPGCGTRAAWCEIHHVTEHARGGATHTDNGVLLCWYHHRFLDRIGWRIRMRRGVPEVRPPAWFDASLRWRPVTSSPVRLRSAIRRT